MGRSLLFGCLLLAGNCLAQGPNQIDFRGTMLVHVEKKISTAWSLTGMAAGTLTYDFQELGFAWADLGAKYRINRHFGVNLNYRPLLSRNLRNFYRLRQILYADLDFSWSRRRWSYGGTARIQQSGFTDFFEAGRSASWYSRNKFNIRYKADYYWQPFVEAELFVPIHHPSRKRPDQWRLAIGVNYTINRYIRVELSEQIQQQINRAPQNTNYLTALNWYIRF